MWRFIGLVLLLLGLLAAALYFKGPSEKLATGGGTGDFDSGEANQVTMPLDVGTTAPPKLPVTTGTGSVLREPILITGCTLSPAAEQQVASRVNGKLVENLVKPGDRATRGQVIGQLDDRQARAAVETARIEAESDATISSAYKKMLATGELLRKEEQLQAGGGGAKQDLLIKKFQFEESQQEYIKAKEAKIKAQKDLAEKRLVLEMHKLVADIDGMVVKVNKRPGSPVREGETLYEIVNTGELWVEGLIPREAAVNLRPGMRVRVEPEKLEAPVRELRIHTAPITGIAVSPDSRLMASASEDGKVVVWDWQAGRPLWVGRDKNRLVEFLSVAFSPVVTEASAGTRQYQLLVGGSDSSARCWTLQLDAQGRMTEGSMKLLTSSSAHTGRIQALAFSPDGRYVATGGTDYQIFLWNLEQQKPIYRVNARKGTAPAHRGFITALAFAADHHLVSAATDKTIKRWQLGKDAASMVSAIDGRTGDVSQLAISPDGKRALFDHADELRVVNLLDGNCEGIMYSRYGQFRNLAAVSPFADMVLTTTAQGRLQLLTMPPPLDNESFFRKCQQAGFQKNDLLLLADLTQRLGPCSWATRGVNIVLAGDQPKVKPLPTFELLPSFPLASAAIALPIMQATPKQFTDLAVVPELWNLGSYEIRHLKIPDGAGVTCGAFAPYGGVFFTGGTDRIVRVWTAPAHGEAQDTVEAVLTYVGGQAETTTTPLIRIRAELDNPKNPTRRLMPNTKANLTIFPDAGK